MSFPVHLRCGLSSHHVPVGHWSSPYLTQEQKGPQPSERELAQRPTAALHLPKRMWGLTLTCLHTKPDVRTPRTKGWVGIQGKVSESGQQHPKPVSDTSSSKGKANWRTNCNTINNGLSGVSHNEIRGRRKLPILKQFIWAVLKSQEGQLNLEITRGVMALETWIWLSIPPLNSTLPSFPSERVIPGPKGSCGISGWWNNVGLPVSEVRRSLDSPVRILRGEFNKNSTRFSRSPGAREPWKELGPCDITRSLEECLDQRWFVDALRVLVQRDAGRWEGWGLCARVWESERRDKGAESPPLPSLRGGEWRPALPAHFPTEML